VSSAAACPRTSSQPLVMVSMNKRIAREGCFLASDQGWLRSVRDFARKEWPMQGSPADVRRHAVLRSVGG
jgi:hypothetical protein